MDVTEENCIETFFDYAAEKYERLAYGFRERCPYRVKGLNNEFAYKQVMSWFLTEVRIPGTGKTALEEFVERLVRERNPELAEKMLRMGKVIRGRLLILGRKDGILTVRDENTSITYRVMASSENVDQYIPGRRVVGRIYPWGEYYKFAGIITIEMSDEELAKYHGFITPEFVTKWYDKEILKRGEEIVLTLDHRLSVILNNMPSELINGICTYLKISKRGRKGMKVKRIVSVLNSEHIEGVLDSLNEESLEALHMVINNEGGFTKYGKLNRRFEDDTSIFWEKNPPRSPLGLLRLHGLLVVGRMYMQGRFYRVALIPADIRQRIRDYLLRRRSIR